MTRRERLGAVRSEVAKAVVGQDAAVSGLLVALLCGGHVLMEGVPGVAKTLLVRTLAGALDVRTRRVQFTPDLMPGDITGSMVIDSKQGELSFREGPLFTNLLLADEINRTPPKTQSALLEAMEEGQVSVDGVSRPLPRPFLVAATQNPVEYEGTYPLPEAQLDRFLLKVVLPIPPREAELEILRRHATGFDPRDVAGAGVRAVCGPDDIAAGQAAVRRVQVSPEVTSYIVDIARATRESPSLSLGVSPRGATALMRASRAWAWLTGRDFVTPDDVKALAQASLAHRLGLRPEAELEGVQVGQVLDSRARVGPRPALMADHLGARQVPLLVLLGLLPVVLRPSFGTMWLWLLAVALAVAVDVLLAPKPALLEVTRRPTAPVRLGEPTSSTLVVANPTGRRVTGLLRDAWQPTAGAHDNRFPLRLTPGDRVLLHTPLRPVRRGDLRAHGVTVRARGPLGLASRQRTVAVPGVVRSLPPFESRKHLPSRLARLRDLDGRSAVRVRGQGTEFDSLREYVRGDDVRSIDWRATARNRNVVVRTWQPERDRRVVLVLDTSRTSAGRVDDVPRLDSAMDAALLLAALAGRAGDRVDFLAGDRRVRARLRATGARDAAATLQDTMADLEPVIAEADWAALAGAVTALGRQRALVVLLTPLESSAVEEGLLPGAADPDQAPPRRRGLGQGPRPRPSRGHAVTTSTRSTTPPRPSGSSHAGAAPPTCSARSRRRRRRRLRRAAAARPRRPLPRAQGPRPALSRPGVSEAAPGRSSCSTVPSGRRCWAFTLRKYLPGFSLKR